MSLLVLLHALTRSAAFYFQKGFYYSICNPGAFTPTAVTYYMINYYIKYLELFDTVFLFLKKKPLGECIWREGESRDIWEVSSDGKPSSTSSTTRQRLFFASPSLRALPLS